MEQPSSPISKKNNPIENEKGAILLITVFIMIILAILFAGMVDFGRVLLARERNQTATDAAALASASSDVKKMVEVTVHTTNRFYEDTCPVRRCETVNGKTVCTTVYEPCGKKEPNHYIKINADNRNGTENSYSNVDIVVTGTEDALINHERWREYCVSDTWSYDCNKYTLNDRWVKYNETAKTNRSGVAEDFYKANMPQKNATIDKVNVYGDEITIVNPYGKNHPAYPSVVVYATVKIKSLFPNMFGAFPESYKTTNCSQGSTYYTNPATGKLIKAPEDWCWQSPE